MLRRAILCCNGIGSRWDPGVPKQLVEVEGEVLLERTVRQLRERDIEPVILASDPQIKCDNVFSYKPENGRWLVETILDSIELWQAQTYILLGDVWFSDNAMDTIASTQGLHWFGRKAISYITGGPAEVFGCSVNTEHEDRKRFVASLEVALEDAKAKDPSLTLHLAGSLWQPYRHLTGISMYDQGRTDMLRIFDHDGVWVEINDFTDDFDSQKRFELWQRRRDKRFI